MHSVLCNSPVGRNTFEANCPAGIFTHNPPGTPKARAKTPHDLPQREIFFYCPAAHGNPAIFDGPRPAGVARPVPHRRPRLPNLLASRRHAHRKRPKAYQHIPRQTHHATSHHPPRARHNATRDFNLFLCRALSSRRPTTRKGYNTQRFPLPRLAWNG